MVIETIIENVRIKMNKLILSKLKPHEFRIFSKILKIQIWGINFPKLKKQKKMNLKISKLQKTKKIKAQMT